MGLSRSGSMEAVLKLPAKQQIQGPPLLPRFAVLSFSLTEGANLAWIWINDKTCVFITKINGHVQ